MLDLINSYLSNKRVFHNLDHITSMIKRSTIFKNDLMSQDLDYLRLAILYHDVIYIPGDPDNEKNSTEYFYDDMKKLVPSMPDVNVTKMIDVVSMMIMDTKTHVPQFTLSKYLIDLDLWELCDPLTYEINRENVIEEFNLAGYSIEEIEEGRMIDMEYYN